MLHVVFCVGCVDGMGPTSCLVALFRSIVPVQNNARALLWTFALIILPGIAYASIAGA